MSCSLYVESNNWSEIGMALYLTNTEIVGYFIVYGVALIVAFKDVLKVCDGLYPGAFILTSLSMIFFFNSPQKQSPVTTISIEVGHSLENGETMETTSGSFGRTISWTIFGYSWATLSLWKF